MNIVVWMLQALLAVVFLLHGFFSVTSNSQATSSNPQATRVSISGFRRLTGVAEILAAAGLVVPEMTGLLPWLTPLAVGGLMIVMVGAIVYHLRRDEVPQTMFVLLLFALSTATALATASAHL